MVTKLTSPNASEPLDISAPRECAPHSAKMTAMREEAELLKNVTDAVSAARAHYIKQGQVNPEVGQKKIAEAVLKGLGHIFGNNPFEQGRSPSGWGEGRSGGR